MSFVNWTFGQDRSLAKALKSAIVKGAAPDRERGIDLKPLIPGAGGESRVFAKFCEQDQIIVLRETNFSEADKKEFFCNLLRQKQVISV